MISIYFLAGDARIVRPVKHYDLSTTVADAALYTMPHPFRYYILLWAASMQMNLSGEVLEIQKFKPFLFHD